MEMEAEISRSFLDWNCDAVCYWLSNIALSNDYSSLFKDQLITGSTLVSLNREELEKIGIIDDADRLKILQQITSMRADLVTSGFAPHMKRSMPKERQFIEPLVSSQHSRGVRCTSQGRWLPRDDSRGISYPSIGHTSNPMAKYVNVLIQEESPRTPDSATSINNSPSCFSVDQTSSDSRDSSRMSSTDKLHYTESATVSHDDGIVHSSEVNHFSKLATMRYHNVKSLSRTMDHLFQDGEDIFSVYQKAMQADHSYEYPSGGRLVDILREENASLKQELETYYHRVRRLQKIEQEVEHIREAHNLLEAGAARREGLEKALRSKLELEVCRLQEESIGLRAEISSARKENNGHTSSEKDMPRKREIRRRDTMITRLIQQNKDAALARELLEKDLQIARAQLQLQLQESKGTDDMNGESGRSSKTSNNMEESDNKIALVYFESIEKLKKVLASMQNMSQKREKLENKLHSQLKEEICRLKKDVPGSVQVGNEMDFAGTLADVQIQNTSLKADIVKWEQKLLELVAEKQMAFDAAIIPKNARIASLERSLAEKIDVLHEIQQQKISYIGQLTDSKRQMGELNIRLTSAQSSLQEKDSVIQMMQKSFLEPEDDGPSITPPQNCQERPNCPDIPCQITELPSSPSPLQSSIQTASTNPKYIVSSTPRNAVRPSSLASALHHSSNHSGQPVSVKALGSNGLKQSGLINGFSPRDQPAPNRWNGHTHTLCSGGRYSSSYSCHHSSNNVLSSSAPNSPNIRNTPHKSRITRSNLRLLQLPGTTERSDLTNRQNHMYVKPNAGHGGMRRSNYQHPPSPRLVKSKTPPPDYHLVSSGRMNSSSPKMLPKKQRHKSVDNILEHGSENSPFHSGKGSMQDQSYRLFRSLVGDAMPPSQNGGGPSERSSFLSCKQVGTLENSNYQDHHQHSESSPCNNFIITSS